MQHDLNSLRLRVALWRLLLLVRAYPATCALLVVSVALLVAINVLAAHVSAVIS